MNHRIRNRLCALLLSAALICPALAAEGAEAERTPDTVTWEDVGGRVRAGNLTALSLAENLDGLDAIDYDVMLKYLRDSMNSLADAQWITGAKGLATPIGSIENPFHDSYQNATLKDLYDTVRQSYEDLKDGTMQADNDAVRRQLTEAVNQIAIGGETLYLNLVSMENKLADAQRGLATLERTLTELRLRHKLGQVSEQTVREVEQTKADLETQIDGLQSAITTLKAQLQLLMGEEPTGELTLGTWPEVTEAQIAAMDPEADLEKAREASYTLLAAQRTLHDAEETWKDAQDDWKEAKKTNRKMADQRLMLAEHAWNAAQLTCQSAQRSFDFSFRSLAKTVDTDRRSAQSKAAALLFSQGKLAVARFKYDRGLISKNALLAAQDDLSAAQSELTAARLQLFMDYQSYQNAVTYGIVK